MFLNRVLLFSIVTFVFVMTTIVIWLKFYPDLASAMHISKIYFVLQLISIILIWFLPTVIIVQHKDIENRGFIAVLSLLLPLVGGLFAYYLLRKHFSRKLINIEMMGTK